jgi:glyoxylase-like metal-dependent hydrolase (beta-lactamase superfamily II)
MLLHRGANPPSAEVRVRRLPERRIERVDWVYALELGMDGRETKPRPAVIATDHGAIFVDAGLPATTRTFVDRLSEAGFSFEDVSTVVLAHQNGDHVGGLRTIADGEENSYGESVTHE